MADVHERYADFDCTVAEMGPLDSGTVNIPCNMRIVEKIRQKDSDPKFITLEVESGISKSKRNWKPEHLEKVARIVNEMNPVAYKGHIPAEKDHTEFPPMHAIWLGATTRQQGDKTLLYLKGYLKSPEIRDEVELEMVNAVSIRGDSTLRPNKGGYYDVVDFDLESIDFTRKSRNGMPARVVSVTAEQTDERGGKSVEAKDIAALDEAELRQHAPLLVKEIERKVSEPLDAKVGEQVVALEALQPQADVAAEIQKLLGLAEGENVVEKVAALMKQIEETASTAIKDFIKEVASKKLKNNSLATNLISRTVGEQVDLRVELTDDVKTEIEAKVDEAIEADEDIKAVVGEMTTGDERTTSGVRTDSRSSKSNGGDNGVVKSNERITVRRAPMTL